MFDYLLYGGPAAASIGVLNDSDDDDDDDDDDNDGIICQY